MPGIQLPSHPYCPRGHIFNKKGFSISRNASGEEVAYILNLKITPQGNRIAIETWSRASTNDEFSIKRTILPKVPYRFMTMDPEFINDLRGTWSEQDYGGVPIFNPSLTFSNDTITGLPTLGYNGKGFVEVNLTRSQAARLNANKEYITQQCSASTTPDFIGNQFISFKHHNLTMNDMQAGMIVKNKDASTDTIYLWVTAQVKMSPYVKYLKLYSTGRRNTIVSGFQSVSYSVPVVLKLEVSRAILTGGSEEYNLLPISWAYAMGTQGNLDSFITETGDSYWDLGGVINTTEGGTLSTKSWNFNTIPGKFALPFNGAVSRYWFSPKDYGTLTDAAWDETNSRLWLTSSHGSYNKARSQWQQIRESLTYDFSSSFSQETSRMYLGSSGKESFTGRVVVEYNDGYILKCFTNLTERDSVGHVMLLWVVNMTTGQSSFMSIANAIAGDVSPFNDRYAIGFYNEINDKYEIYKSPTPANMVSLFGKRSFPNQQGLLAKQFTLIEQKNLNSEPGKFSKIVNRNLSIPRRYVPVDSDDRTLQENEPFSHQSTYWPVIKVLYGSIIMLNEPGQNYFKSSPILVGYSSPHLIDDFVGPISSNDDGVDEGNYFRLQQEDKGRGAIQSINPYTNTQLQLFGSGNIGFWEDPAFTSDDGNGLKCMFYLNNCSGVFRKTTGVGAWNPSIAVGQAGVEIDFKKTRQDIQTQYGGNYDSFISSGGSGYYWAGLVDPPFTFSMVYAGQQLVLDEGDYLAFVGYDTTGNHSIHVHARLDLDGITDTLGRSYDEAGYNLEGVDWALSIHTNDVIYHAGTVNITPPEPNGSITTGGVYKTVSDTVSFSVTRVHPTTIRDIIIYKNQDEVIRTESPYTLRSDVTGTFSADATTINKGETINATYRPLYFDSRGSDDSISTEIVTKVSGHKYHLDNVSILIGGVDKTYDIFASEKPYLYLAPASGSVPIEVQADILHENFDVEAYPTTLENVYPVIAKTYLMVVPRIYFKTAERGARLLEQPPLNAPLTYPNGSNTLSTLLLQTYASTAAGQKDENTHGGTTIEISSESLSASVMSSDAYQIYLIVVDEFGQKSSWCITNVVDNYAIPFRRI